MARSLRQSLAHLSGVRALAVLAPDGRVLVAAGTAKAGTRIDLARLQPIATATGAGWLGAIIVGLVGAALTLGIGQFLLIVVQPLWARMLIAFVFVAPAALAGYPATHGIVKHTMPSEAWQIVFSIVGAVAVGATAFMRVAGMAAAVPPSQRLARA